MLNKMLKIMACCIFACSLSYNGNTSDGEDKESLSPRPSPVALLDLSLAHHSSDVQGEESLPPLPSPVPPLDLDPAHNSSDQASSAPLPTEVSLITEEPTNSSSATLEKRKVKRTKSTSSKDSSVSPSSSSEKRKVKRTKSTGLTEDSKSLISKKPPLSQGMQVAPSEAIASLFSALTHDTKPRVTHSKSENLFAPKELLPVHLLLALLANETKVSTDCPHPIVYLPDCGFFIGYKDMLYSTLDQFKKSLKFSAFSRNQNLINALELLCICGEQDLEKILNEQDMEMAKHLIIEAQEDQWYQTHVKAILDDATERYDANTVGYLRGQENTKSNSTSYALYSHGKLLEPEPVITDTLKKSKKVKKKIQPKEEEDSTGIQISLSVTKVILPKKASTSKSSKSGSSTPRKRAKSKGANANAASSSASSLAQVEEDSKNLENKLESGEEVIESSSQPQEKDE